MKIGVLYPLSGNAASAGNHAKMASELGADLINTGDPELAKLMPIAKGGGLPGLKGAKIELVVADNQGTPAAGQNQALRLITQEKVVAIIGFLPVRHHPDRKRRGGEIRHSPSSRPSRPRAISPSAASSGSSAPRRCR